MLKSYLNLLQYIYIVTVARGKVNACMIAEIRQMR